jgi:hypothetical protein
MNVERDDGAVIYLNGAELARFNMPTGAISSTNFAAANAFDDGTVFSMNFPSSVLRQGTNVFAVEIHQESGASSDIWFQMQLIGNPIIIHNQSPTVRDHQSHEQPVLPRAILSHDSSNCFGCGWHGGESGVRRRWREAR